MYLSKAYSDLTAEQPSHRKEEFVDDERNKTEEHLAPCSVERRVDIEEEEEGEKDETWGEMRMN